MISWAKTSTKSVSQNKTRETKVHLKNKAAFGLDTETHLILWCRTSKLTFFIDSFMKIKIKEAPTTSNSIN